MKSVQFGLIAEANMHGFMQKYFIKIVVGIYPQDVLCY